VIAVKLRDEECRTDSAAAPGGEDGARLAERIQRGTREPSVEALRKAGSPRKSADCNRVNECRAVSGVQ